MEPFKALTFLAGVGIVSLVGAGAAGFYAGYSAGRGNLDEIKAQVISASGGGIALRPVQDDIRALSKQVETLASLKPATDPVQAAKPVLDEIKALGHQLEGWKVRAAADSAESSAKPVLEEIRALARQVETLKGRPSAEPEQGTTKAVLEEIKALTRQVETLKTGRPAAEPEQGLKPVLEEIRSLGRQVEALKTARPAAGDGESAKALLEDVKSLTRQVEALKTARTTAESGDSSKPVLDEIKALSRQVEAFRTLQPARGPEGLTGPVMPDYTEALATIREQVAGLSVKFDKQQEPKAPKALVDEIRSLSASVQAQEPVVRRAITEELRTAVATLQNGEPKVSKALLDELHTISANTRPDPRPQPNVADQIKVLSASIESLKARIAEDGGRGRGDGGASISGEVAQLQQLVAAASDQFGRCQTQLASLPGAGAGSSQAQVQPAAAAPAATTVAMSQAGHQPATVVFYDNVMLKKDQEKQYDEIGVKLALQSVGPRQVKVAVNRQGVGLSFGERKVFRSQDV
jgi:HAMP domain-containing protein